MLSLYDRMKIQAGWDLKPLFNSTLHIIANGHMANILSLFSSCIGLSRQLIVTPKFAEAFAIANATQEHTSNAEINSTTPKLYRSPRNTISDGELVVLIDVGDPEFLDLTLPKNAKIIGFGVAEADGHFLFGDLREVRTKCNKKPLQARAELSILAAEMLNAVCAELKVFKDPETGVYLANSDILTMLPLSKLPTDAQIKPMRIYIGGLGGTISHHVCLAASLDPHLQQMLGSKESVIVGADMDHVEESNLSRQCGYTANQHGESKAEATAKWLSNLFPNATVTGFNEAINKSHFSRPFDVVLSSVDSWNARRELATLTAKNSIPLWLSAGASFFGGFARVVSPTNACPYRHGIEKLEFRQDRVASQSCAARSTPEPSSLIPQAMLSGLLAASLRNYWLGLAVEPRGYEVNLRTISTVPGYTGLRYSPGRNVNTSCDCPGVASYKEVS